MDFCRGNLWCFSDFRILSRECWKCHFGCARKRMAIGWFRKKTWSNRGKSALSPKCLTIQNWRKLDVFWHPYRAAIPRQKVNSRPQIKGNFSIVCTRIYMRKNSDTKSAIRESSIPKMFGVLYRHFSVKSNCVHLFYFNCVNFAIIASFPLVLYMSAELLKYR